MPIVGRPPEYINVSLEPLKIKSDSYSSIVIDNDTTPHKDLLPYVNGSSWIVNYYSQILTEHTDLRRVDVSQDSIYQQYKKIVGLEVKVISSLNLSQDTDQATSLITGSALVFGGVIPNAGDHFVAYAGDTNSLFGVNRVDRKSFNQQSVYQIEYTLLNFINRDPDTFLSLESKVKQIFYFIKDQFLNNQAPLVNSEDQQSRSNLRRYYSEFIYHYFQAFFHNSFRTFMIPANNYFIYDNYVVKTISSILKMTDHENMLHLNLLSTNKLKRLTEKTIWDCLLDRSKLTLSVSQKEMDCVNKTALGSNPTLSTSKYIPYNYLIYPKLNLNNDVDGIGISFPFNDKIETDEIFDITITDIRPVKFDSAYILSFNFYNQTDTQCLLERLVSLHINRDRLNVVELDRLCSQVFTWPKLEKFYYIPILLILIKTTISGL